MPEKKTLIKDYKADSPKVHGIKRKAWKNREEIAGLIEEQIT